MPALMVRPLPILALLALFSAACGGSENTPEGAAGSVVAGSMAAHASGGLGSGALGGTAGAVAGSGGASAGTSVAGGGAGTGGLPTTPSAGSESSGGTPAIPGGSGGMNTTPVGEAGAGGAPAAGTGAGGTGVGGTSGGSAGKSGNTAGATSLHQKYADYFPIGAAVDNQSYRTHATVLSRHFNSITLENEMKWEALQPTQGNFTYGTADQIVNYAVQNNMRVRGHALVWFRQNPSWVFAGSNGGRATPEQLLERMRSHISNVVRHFKGKVYAWDVVNEAVMDNGELRTGNEVEDQRSQWYEILGERFIAEAFRAAHEADPEAKLFYNDYYDWIPAKHQGIHRMLKKLLDEGVPVHGVGMQCHLNIERSTVTTNQGYLQTVENLESAIKLYSSLGLEVHVTEMDVSLYIPGMMYTQDTFYTAATFTTALQEKQAARYAEFFDLFRRYKENITSVTFWGIADDNTWLSEFSSGRKDFPLLFDANQRPKKAYDAVVAF